MADHEELYTTEILAWRGWNIDELFYLCSSNEHEPWGIGRTVARCRTYGKAHHAPIAECSCGLYGVFSPHQVPAIHSGRADFLIGLAAYWGKTQLGDQGLRAQYAKPYCIIAPVSDHPGTQRYLQIAKEVTHRYSIPILEIDEADEQFKQHLPASFTEKKEREERKEEAIKKLGTPNANLKFLRDYITQANPPNWVDPDNEIDLD